ncbi:MAG: hypothetical protein ACTSO3_11315 [Candidatus Heimdallarchaeaceae archaeon]
MNKRQILLCTIVVSLVVGTSVFAANQSAVAIENPFETWNPSDFEENCALLSFDIWANISVSAMPSKTIEVNFGVFMADRESLENIYGFDYLTNNHYHAIFTSDAYAFREITLSEGFGSQSIGETIFSNEFTVQEDLSETGYSSFSDRETDPVYDYTEKDLTELGANTVVMFNTSAYLNNTELPADTNNLIIDDDTSFNGVNYIAADGKSLNNLATDMADSFSGVLVGVKNTTLIGFGFGDLEDLANLQLQFDDQTGSASLDIHPDLFITRRRTFPLFRRFRDAVTGRAKVRTSLFKRLTGTIAGLINIPRGATHYIKNPIGSIFRSFKLGGSAIGGGLWETIKRAIGKIAGIAAGIIGLIIMVAVIAFVVRKVKRKK